MAVFHIMQKEEKSMRPMYRTVALVLVLIMLVGCGVTVTPTESTTPAAATAAPATATPAPAASETAAVEATATPVATATPIPIDMSISALRFSSDPGSPNTREELAKTYPEYAKDHTAKVVCFEMGWTGPVKDKDSSRRKLPNALDLRWSMNP